MRIKNIKQTYHLNSADIDTCSEDLSQLLETYGLERQNRIRIRFMIEELLLRFRDRFDESTEYQLVVSSRFGSPYVQIDLAEEPYNPLNQVEHELDDWVGSMLNSLGISPQYNYSSGHNILRIALPARKMNPVIRTLIAIAMGVLGGLLLKAILPADTADLLHTTLFEPVYYLWMRILNLLSGPIIFFMVVTTILEMGRLNGKGANSWKLVFRYFLITFLIIALIVGILSILFHLIMGSQTLDRVIISEILDSFFRIVPSEIVLPFMEANTPQLILLGFVLGTVLVILREQTPHLTKLVKEINSVCLLLAEWISWLVPIFIGILLFLEIEGGQIMNLLMIWEPLIFSLLLTVLVLMITFLFTAARKHVAVSVLIQKTVTPFLLTLKTGSLSNAYGQTELFCIRQMGMDKDFTEISLSHGVVLYMPASVLGAVVFTLWASSQYDVHASWLNYLVTIILTIILMEAAPPVPGVSLLVYISVFGILGIPETVLIPAMVFDIIFGIFANAANLTMLQIEMIHQADRYGLLNRTMLKKPYRRRNQQTD